jgi:hypothetical protein
MCGTARHRATGDNVADVLSAKLSVGRPLRVALSHFYAKNGQWQVWYNVCFERKRRATGATTNFAENKYNN